MRHVLNPPNALMLMESTRAVGYSLEAAIADLIDNSISANSRRVDIFFSNIDEPYLAILDDGHGMCSEELFNAMKYGCKNPTDVRDGLDLGRFGLGLKTASLSQCKVLTVVSKTDQGVHSYRWDLNYIKETDDWFLLQLEPEEILKLPCIDKIINMDKGTLVIWTDLDKFSISDSNAVEAFRDKMPVVRSHLELVFHRFIQGEPGIKKVEIRVNGLELVPADPFLKMKSQQIMDVENININGAIVSVTPYVLPHQSRLTSQELNMLGGKEGLRRKQGFYVYRNKRLLVYGSWFRLVKTNDLSKLARVQIDIPNSLDKEWTLDIKKSIATPPDAVKRNLRRIVERIANTSTRVYKTRGKKETDDSKLHPWNRTRLRDNSILYEVNRDYPTLIELRKSLNNEQQKLLESSLKIIEQGLPIYNIRLDINNENQLALENINNEEMKLVKDVAGDMFQNTDSIDSMRDTLLLTEPFASHATIVNSVYEVFKSER